MTDTMSLKKELRKRIAGVLKATSDGEVSDQSARLARNVCALPEFRRAAAVSVYLHMPKEADTIALLEAAFAANKTVYVPKITGKQADEMCMVKAQSLADILAFPKDNWQIPDPPLTFSNGNLRQDPAEALDLDLILLPGVAFDRSGGRLGHGKGYYDSFLRRLGDRYTAHGKPNPTLVGLCLSPQLIAEVPVAPHDRMLDVVVTPDEIIRLD